MRSFHFYYINAISLISETYFFTLSLSLTFLHQLADNFNWRKKRRCRRVCEEICENEWIHKIRKFTNQTQESKSRSVSINWLLLLFFWLISVTEVTLILSVCTEYTQNAHNTLGWRSMKNVARSILAKIFGHCGSIATHYLYVFVVVDIRNKRQKQNSLIIN